MEIFGHPPALVDFLLLVVGVPGFHPLLALLFGVNFISSSLGFHPSMTYNNLLAYQVDAQFQALLEIEPQR